MFGGKGYFYFADALGCPTSWGFAIHIIVFFLLARGLFDAFEMYEKDLSKYNVPSFNKDKCQECKSKYPVGSDDYLMCIGQHCVKEEV
jgi:hypothetical protein